MHPFRLLSLGFAVLLLASKWQSAGNSDPQALQGAWEIVFVTRHGVPDPTPVGYTLRFIDNEVHFQGPLGSQMPLFMGAIQERQALRIPS